MDADSDTDDERLTESDCESQGGSESEGDGEHVRARGGAAAPAREGSADASSSKYRTMEEPVRVGEPATGWPCMQDPNLKSMGCALDFGLAPVVCLLLGFS